MAVQLARNYAGYLAGAIVNLPAQLEAALVAQRIASVAVVANVTAGNVTVDAPDGTAAIAPGASSVVITNRLITPASKVFACVAQAAADATLLRVERVVCGAGQVTIYGTANATAKTLIDWAILPPAGMTIVN